MYFLSKVRPIRQSKHQAQHSHGKRKWLWLETIIIGLKTNSNCRVIVYCHLHSHKYFQKVKKLSLLMWTLPGPAECILTRETGETNIIFAPGLSSNKYFGCWAQTKWPWPPAALAQPRCLQFEWAKTTTNLFFVFTHFK